MSSEKTTRRDRVIMGLGIVALLLFVANVYSAIKQQFFGHRPHAETVVVHELHPVPHVSGVVVAPRIRHSIHVTTEHAVRTEALVKLRVRLLEEADRLSAEAARLAGAGHVDAAIPLRESVDEVQIKIADLQREIDEMRETLGDDGISFTVVAPDVN